MKRTRIVGLALVAMFAMAVSATAAFGFSEFKTNGKFPVELKEGKGGAAFFESTGGKKVECEKSKTKAGAKIESATLAKAQVEYEGNCKLSSGQSCGTSGKITTEPLKIKPGDEIEKAGEKKPAGVLINPVSGEVLAKFSCTGLGTIEVKGNLVCESPEAGAPHEKAKVVCAQSSKGVQKYTAINVEGTRKTGLKLKAVGIFGISEEEAQNTTEELVFPTGTTIEQTL